MAGPGGAGIRLLNLPQVVATPAPPPAHPAPAAGLELVTGIDSRGPYVVSMEPGGLAAPIEATVRIRFSQAMRRQSVERTLQITPGVQGEVGWPDPQTVEFKPVTFLYATAYHVSVGGISAMGDRLLGGREWDFATRTPPPVPPVYPFTLTFDDCGTPQQIQAVIDAVVEKQMRPVFFPTGVCRDTYPWLVPRLMALGPVCNHTYSHLELTRWPNAVIASQIAGGVSTAQTGCRLFRPPYGAWDGPRGRIAALAAASGYQVQLWDVDTRDWAGTSAADMVRLIRARGGIVLMHFHGIHTVEAIRAL